MSRQRSMISIITPVFNEQDNVEPCARAVAEVMRALPDYDYEHIFADNASTDETVEALRALAEVDPHIKVIVNSRNVGPFRNAANAMRSASGDAVVPMLAVDLQDPPEVITQFVWLWEQGYYVVYGVRTNRNETTGLKIARGLYYRLLRWFGSDFQAPAHAGEFALLDAAVVGSILSVDDHYPYIRGLIAQTGAKYATVSYTWAPRIIGRSKNNWFQLVDQGANGFVTTSRAPARMALLVGFAAALAGILYGLAALVWLAFFSREGTGAGIPTLIVGVFVLGGLQLFFIGLIGEYLLSVHGQVRRAPPMFETERINFGQ